MKPVALVTGVTGMIGRRVAGDLGEQGYQVCGLARRALDDSTTGQERPWAPIDCDLRDGAQIAAVLRHCQPALIIHAAAAQGSAGAAAPGEELYATNVTGTLHLLEAARHVAPAARVIVAGSGACYGPAETPRRRWTEQAPLRPPSLYAASKAAADLTAQAYAAAFGLDVVVARLFNVLGPTRDSASAPAWFARQVAEMAAGLREPQIACGNLQAVRDFIDYRDAAAALCRLAVAPLRHRVYNVCSGRGTPLHQLLRRLLRHGRVQHYRLRPAVPDRPDRVVGSPARLLRETGWRPVVDLACATADLLQFWRERVRA